MIAELPRRVAAVAEPVVEPEASRHVLSVVAECSRKEHGMRLRNWVVGAVAAAAALAVPAGAQEKAWSLDLGVDYASHYMFRGVPLLGDNEVLIPSAWFTVGNFSAYYYGYRGDIPADFTFSGNEADYGEDDLGVEYAIPIGETFSLTLGGVWYLYSGETEEEYAFFDTYEAYATAAWDVMLQPRISYWHDLDAVEGGYLQVGIGNSYPMGSKASFDWTAALGIDFGYNLNEGLAADLGLDESSGDLNDVLIGIDVPVQITDWFSFHVAVQQSIALDVLEDIGVDDETIFQGGVTFSF
jgi:hypothetical protein